MQLVLVRPRSSTRLPVLECHQHLSRRYVA